MNKNTWYGKRKYHYEVYNKSSRKIYTCTSINDDQNYVIDQILKMFDDGKNKCRIKCNGEVVKKVNYKIQSKYKKIIDKNTGRIYQNLEEMSDDLFLTKKEAKNYIKTLMRYEWMD